MISAFVALGANLGDPLAQIRQAVGWGKAHGLRTVLDMHQDGWYNQPSPKGITCRPGTASPSPGSTCWL